MFPGACTLKFGQREKFALKIAPDWGVFCGRRKGAKILRSASYPTHKTRGSYGQWPILGIDFSAKQASNRGIESWGFGGFISPKFFSIFTNFFLRIFQVEIFRIFFGNFFSDFFPYRGSSTGGTTSYAGIPIFTVLFWYYSSITTYPGL